MYKRQVQQIATPQEVFNHPANIFVAGFIGVPPMNFFDAQLVRSGNGFTVKTEDMNVALAPETVSYTHLDVYKRQGRRLPMPHVTSIGLDVHARSVAAAAFSPFTGEVVHLSLIHI